MRLSVFNGENPHNVVYALTPGPVRLADAPEALVARQLSGRQLRENLTAPLPVTVQGGTLDELDDALRGDIAAERDPVLHNGLARETKACDRGGPGR